MSKEVEARKKIDGNNFEILVDVDKALQLKDGIDVNIENVLIVDEVFSDAKKGEKAPSSNLEKAFGTTDVRKISEKIIKTGEIQLPAEYRKKKLDKKKKQVINFIARNAVNPQDGKPHSEQRIESAIKEAGINIENKPIEKQIDDIMSKLKEVLPVKIETKKLKVNVPATHTGKIYGMLKEYSKEENWLPNGNLECVITIPAGLEMEFYDKLNKSTKGSAVVEEEK